MKALWPTIIFLPMLTCAQDLPTEASALQFEFEVIVAEKQKPIETLNGHYLKRLAAVEKEIQSEGDLHGVLAVKEEKEAIEKTGKQLADPPEGEPEALEESRAIYIQSRESLEESIEKEIAPERQSLLAKLAELKQKYTKESRLADAKAVMKLAERIASETPDPIMSSPSAGRLGGDAKFKVQVDGKSHLKIRGDEIWFDHTNGGAAKPGLHRGVFPTYVDRTTEWMPVWNDKITERFDAGIGLPMTEPMPELRLRGGEGRGFAEIVEQPSPDNGFTATIEMRDQREDGRGFFGSDWMSFRVSW